MKILKRVLLILIIIIIISVVVIAVFLNHLKSRAIPNYNADIYLKNMKETVTVYRDQYAVPHIFAKNDEDLYRAVGYVMAQDRLWQMDLLRRTTSGRLSEIFGEKLIKTDLLMRALRITEKSNSLLTQCSPKIRTALEAFSDGVNQYIDYQKSKLPPEFFILNYTPEYWQAVHSLNLIGYMSWDLTTPWVTEFLLYKLSKKIPKEKYQELLPDLSLIKPAVFPNFEFNDSQLELSWNLLSGITKIKELGLQIFTGSNNWAVSGKKSKTGKPLLANDMHLGLWAPGIWYQIHQVVENPASPLNVTGVIIPGQPFIVAGHNNDIAWGMTNVMVDDMDFYLESINPNNPNQYLFNGHWRDMEVRKEIFHTGEGKDIIKELKFTHRGPVISEIKDFPKEVISIRWLGNEYSNEVRSVYLLNRAKNWDEFRDALKTFTAVSQNIVYADIKGNIGLQTAAGIPLREGNGIFVVPGDTNRYDWKGIVPFDELPFSFNPDNGYVSSANNKTVGDNYPYYISRWFAVPDRINRIRDLLKMKNQLTCDDFKKMHGDVKSRHVKRFLPDILEILHSLRILDEKEAQVMHVLSQWDGEMSRNSIAATMFEYLYIAMVKTLVKDELGESLYQEFLGNKTLIRNLIIRIWKDRNSHWCDNITTAVKEDFYWWIKTSFKEAVQDMVSQMGENTQEWQWGKVHKLMLKHPLGRIKILDKLFQFNRGPFTVGGSFHTVCPFSYSFRNPFISEFGASHRHIYNTANWDDSFSVIPTGISGIPASPYYCDQTKLYINNRYHPDYTSSHAVKKTARFTMIIKPQ